MGLATYSTKAVTLYDTLEAVALGGTYCIQKIAFGKHILNAYFFAEFGNSIELCAEVTKLNHVPLGCGISFLEVTYQRLGCVLFFLLSEGQLQGRVTIRLLILDLGDYAGTCLDDGTRDILAILAKYARHSNLTSYDSRDG